MICASNLVALGLALVLLLPSVTLAEISREDLYQARTIVTGQELPSRRIGFARGLEEVLVKVSGDPRLLGDPRLGPLLDRADDLVSHFSYRDRMQGIPVHDEQGTRDRPFDLTVQFSPEVVNAQIRRLGREPWLTERPIVIARITIQTGEIAYLLTEDGERGRGQREALQAASWRIGIPVQLPSQSEGSGEDPSAIAPGQAALVGSLTWSNAAAGWVAEWRLRSARGEAAWGVNGVSFDEAFRNALRGAAQILSGHGGP